MMRSKTLTIGLTGFLLAPLLTQAQPGLQNLIERQAERAQTQAVERTVRQAEQVQNRAVERVEARAEVIQNQAIDRVQNQVERVQSQAVERSQGQVERVQGQAAERAQGRIERAQNQAAERAQGQVTRAQEQVERAQARASERAETVAQVVERQAGPPAERLQNLPEPAQGAIAAQQGRGGLINERAAAAAAGGQAADERERRIINDQGGAPAFVEIVLQPNIRAIEFEWVMLVDTAQRQRLDTEAAALLPFLADVRPFSATGSELLTFRVPPDLDANDNILQLLPDDLRGFIDRNHVYSVQNTETALPVRTQPKEGDWRGLQLPMPMRAVCEAPLAVGMIDSAIADSHPAFVREDGHGVSMTTQSFVEPGLVQPTDHGTAVASLLVGRQPGASDKNDALQPLLPNASLYSATVFYAQQNEGQGTTLLHLLEALDWLVAQEDLQVINMSLAGPANRLLAMGIEGAVQRGKVIVAAAGNEGPHGEPRYPAAYDNVISVTAVDRDTSIYRWANQGDYIDFAALGVSVPVAKGEGGFGRESGTSMAAPVVTAFLACELQQQGDVKRALASLQARLLDLGAPGKDPIFGHGLLHPL